MMGVKAGEVTEWGEEREEGAIYTVCLRRVHITQGLSKGARWLGAVESGEEGGGFVESRSDTRRARVLRAATLERLVEHLLASRRLHDSSFVTVFLATFRTFATPLRVLQMLLDRFATLQGLVSAEELEQSQSQAATEELNGCLCSILGAWLDGYGEDFREPPDFESLRLLLSHAAHSLPGSDVERRAHTLLAQLQQPQQQQQQQLGTAWRSSGAVGPWPAGETRPDFLSFSADVVASQLTFMDAELFKRVVPHDCLGSVWSRRDLCGGAGGGGGGRSGSVRATVRQFNAVAGCVVSTVLDGALARPAHRAKVIQRWVTVAQECRLLKNFSSLRAVVSALQSNPIYRLKRTWAVVARDTSALFEELSDIFSGDNNHLNSRELLLKEASSKFATLESHIKDNHKKVQKRLQMQKETGAVQGTVPYLGTFLTDLTMLDTALPDHVQGGLVNFEKRRREFEVLAQIKLLQSACNSYSLRPEERFLAWFHSQPSLSEEQSYLLSRQLEPPVESTLSPCPRKKVIRHFSGVFSGADSPFLAAEGGGPRVRRCQSGRVGSSGSASEGEGPPPTPPPPSPTAAGGRAAPQIRTSGSEPEIRIFVMPPGPEGSEWDDTDTAFEGSSDASLAPPPRAAASASTPGSPEKRPRAAAATAVDGAMLAAPSSRPAGARTHKRSGSDVPSAARAASPACSRRSEGECIVRVSLERANGNLYKSVLLTSQDKTPVAIRKAMTKHNMEAENPDDFLLVQVIGEGKEFAIPDGSNVYYAMVTSPSYNFILRKRSSGRRRGGAAPSSPSHHSASSASSSSSFSSVAAAAPRAHASARAALAETFSRLTL
ncbi:ral guanine nucleotide dissociation stimulator-like 1 isoform X2 [Lethenteron reissneri]|uniref:ral guanine nucleotide dissociation stimulator-like 1 isoform X2 n=1 Tax=Lethenteron reissneri TaxID=7753 RepID=UPI002AB7E555|nr:ral guanine nucleotide dissociation stimulator-like 1 isoform X2 [Lethenteron reissneri]